jgi:uncharacterized membrane protein YvbJ
MSDKYQIQQYDSDTTFGTPNFIPGEYAVNKGKECYMGYVYDEFVKNTDNIWSYDFALVNNGKVIAIGDEQMRCGGITHTCREKDFETFLKKSPVYGKVSHLPIANEDELEEPEYRHFKSYEELSDYLNEKI